MEEIIVSLYKNISSPIPYLVKVGDIFNRIKNPKDSVIKLIEEIRTLTVEEFEYGKDWVSYMKRSKKDKLSVSVEDEEKYEHYKALKKRKAELKGQLPTIRFSGKFSGQNDADLYEHSGLLVLDFDHIPEADWQNTFNSLCDLDFCFACFRSPSGDGIKMVIRIPRSIKSHRGFFMGAMDMFSNEIDPTGINEARACFESYDPNIYINENAVEFTNFVYEKERDYNFQIIAKDTTKRDFSKAQLCVDMIANAMIGERHNTVLKAAKLFGGYLQSGLTTIEDRYALEGAVRNLFDGENVAIELRALDDGIKEGMKNPIYLQETPMSIIKTATNNGIIRLNERRSVMEKYYYDGKIRGTTTYFPQLDNHFSFRETELTLWSGVGNSGKSTFLYQLLLVQALFTGVKTAIFTPENAPAEEFYDTMCEMLKGQTVDKNNKWSKQMTIEDYKEAMTFINDHFFFIFPDESHTIEDIESNFIYAIENYGVKHVVVDPYNQLFHKRPSHLREDEYLSEFLRLRKRFATHYRVYYHIVSHPNSSMKTNSDGEYPVMSFFNLAGGAMWSNKVDNFMVIHRPTQNTSPESTNVDVYSKKIKHQKLVGIPGKAEFTFNRNKQWFMDKYLFNPIDSMNRGEDPKDVFNTVELVSKNTSGIIHYSEPAASEEVPF